MEIDPLDTAGDSSELASNPAHARLNTWVAFTVALLATFMGICKVKDDNIVQAMQQAQADRIDNWRNGAFALWLGSDGIIVESANASRGDRPWVPHPISARERARRAQPEQKQEEPVAPEPEFMLDPRLLSR